MFLKENESIKDNIKYSKPIQKVIVTKDLVVSNIGKEKDTILLVDDNIEMLYFLQSSLKDMYNVFFASNGTEALDKIKNIPRPDIIISDIIISDIMMDKMNGHDFFINLSTIDEYKSIPYS